MSKIFAKAYRSKFEFPVLHPIYKWTFIFTLTPVVSESVLHMELATPQINRHDAPSGAQFTVSIHDASGDILHVLSNVVQVVRGEQIPFTTEQLQAHIKALEDYASAGLQALEQSMTGNNASASVLSAELSAAQSSERLLLLALGEVQTSLAGQRLALHSEVGRWRPCLNEVVAGLIRVEDSIKALIGKGRKADAEKDYAEGGGACVGAASLGELSRERVMRSLGAMNGMRSASDAPIRG